MINEQGDWVLPFGGVGQDVSHGELGGVQLLFKIKNAKFFLDFGQRPDHFGLYWSFPRAPRKYDVLDISSQLDLFAEIPGIFRFDYEWHRGRFTDHHVLGKYIPENPIDGVILTHSHFDHVGWVSLLRPDMPIYTNRFSTLMLYYWQYVSGGGTLNQFVDYHDQFSAIPNL